MNTFNAVNNMSNNVTTSNDVNTTNASLIELVDILGCGRKLPSEDMELVLAYR